MGMSFFYDILLWQCRREYMRIYNTKNNRLEEFKPIKENEVSMYLCGPTVYNHAHIGNARPIVVFDLLRRVLIADGYKVHYVSNFTDIDDKIIKKAIEEDKTEAIISQKYVDAYNDIRQKLFADSLDSTPRVTETMDEIIDFIGHLIEKNVAYIVDGNVYFRVDKISDYGSISNQNLDELRVGSRIEVNAEKENPLDFVLWKKTKEGITWKTPWGEGRPGWHTECVVMIHKEFKTHTIDIHAGGQDLKFPHHENESAQNKALHHHDLANYWVHNAMLNIDDEKMSKSLGNVFWAKDFIEKFGSNVSRWILLSTHYRMTLNITDKLIEQVQNEVSRIKNSLNKAHIYVQINNLELSDEFSDNLYNKFLEGLKDDLNVANADQFLFETIKRLNQALRQKNNGEVVKLLNTLEKMINVLGLSFDVTVLNDEDYTLLETWNNLKSDKKYDEADKIREKLIKRGIL